jgi:hypothetical protein
MVYIKNKDAKTLTFKKHYYESIKTSFRISLIALAMAAAYFCIFTFGLPKFMSGKQDDLVFGIIILLYLRR